MGRTKKRNSITRNIKNKAIIAVSIFFVVFVGIAAFGNSTVKGWAGLIYPGVTVDGTDVSGMNKEQAAEILTKNQKDAISNKKINVTVEGKTYSLDYSKLKPTYDIKATVDEAFAYGKDLSLFGKFSAIKFSKDKALELKLDYDDKALSEFISTIEKELSVEAVDAKIDVNGGFIITPEKDGKRLDKEALKKELLSKINGKLGEDTNISASMITSKANVTADELKNINAKISTFSTNYGSISSSERANNISLATKSVNGTVLMPGQTFSFNGAVGERTVA
ncbi:MAG TPA: peptidoglycan binding domain-containing protein, partial [Clostridiaceae bacterium]